MNVKKPYSAIGGVFEYLNDDCGYEQWSQYLIEKLRAYGVGAGACGADFGCGNGYFTRAFYKAGYAVKGFDISPEMLSAAVEQSRKEGDCIEFLSGDISKTALNFKAGFITAVNDCINYIPPEKLEKTFARVYKNLGKGGVFIFDVSSENKLKNILGNNLFAEDRGDVAYMWFNTLNGGCVDMDITLFARRKDGLFERKDERQTQYIHRETDILSALQGAGFRAESEGHLDGGKEERICFYAVKL